MGFVWYDFLNMYILRLQGCTPIGSKVCKQTFKMWKQTLNNISVGNLSKYIENIAKFKLPPFIQYTPLYEV